MRGVVVVSYYPTLTSIKLDLATHSLGFELSKSFLWQPGLLLFMVLPNLLSSAVGGFVWVLSTE